jgi:hypothetical protein
MKLRPIHFIGIGILVVGIIAVIVLQVTGLGRNDGTSNGNLAEVTGVVGSEKKAFFEDPAVQEVFAEHGYEVNVTTSGSWHMASLDGLTDNDFAFPASEIAAEHIESTHPEAVLSTHKPFFSPLAIATFEPVMELLEKNGAATQDANGSWQVDMAAYLDLVESDTRWNQLDGAADLYNSPRSVMITSTDIRTSNSAGMYLALAAYVLNGESVLTSQSQAAPYLDTLTQLFVAQGYAGASSAAPFEDYLSQGIGAVPMVFVYEGQFLEEQVRDGSRIQDGMVLAYPTPTIFSVHTGVTFSDAGQDVMQLLETDPELASLLAAHGFRPTGQNSNAFADFTEQEQIAEQYPSTSAFVNLAQEPSYEMLDYLLTEIGSAYDVSGAPPATPETDSPEQDSTGQDESP